MRVLSDNQLIDLGVTALGDRSMLRNFCQCNTGNPSTAEPLVIAQSDTTTNANSNNQRQQLLSMIRQNYPSGRVQGPRRRPGRPVRSERAVQFGLRILDEETTITHPRLRNTKTVKAPLGDKNMISIKMDPNVGYQPFLETVKKAFFPDGVNPAVGEISLVHHFEIVNGLNVNICEGLDEFTLNRYI